MKILNGKELEQTPHLIISFGGGMGGFSYHYRYVKIKNVDGGTLEGTGFSVPPALLKEKNIFAYAENTLVCFLLVSHPKKIRDGVREMLLKGSIEGAKMLLMDHLKKCPNPCETVFIDIRIQQIMACGNWLYTGPDLSKVQEDFVICAEENFGNSPLKNHGDDTDVSFKYLEDAREHLGDMIDSSGLYIVHRTEEIIHDGE